jgi:hypothetical protein
LPQCERLVGDFKTESLPIQNQFHRSFGTWWKHGTFIEKKAALIKISSIGQIFALDFIPRNVNKL